MGLILGFRSIPSPGIVLISDVKYIYDPETLTTMGAAFDDHPVTPEH